MARINIEDSIYKDARFFELVRMSHSIDEAIGRVVRAWTLAQQYFLNESTNRLIPLKEWEKQKISDALIKVGLAESHGEFVYVSGTKEHFQWLLKSQSAGRKYGKGRAKGTLGYPNQPKDDLTSISSSSSSSLRKESMNESTIQASRPNDAKRQEIRMKFGKELQEIEDLLKTMFPGMVPKKLLHRTVDILDAAHGDMDKVRAELNDIWQSPKIRSGEGIDGQRASYIAKAILNNFGLE